MSVDDEKGLKRRQLLQKLLWDVLGEVVVVTDNKPIEIDGKYYQVDKFRDCLAVHVKSGIGGGWHPFKDKDRWEWVLKHYAPMKPPDID